MGNPDNILVAKTGAGNRPHGGTWGGGLVHNTVIESEKIASYQAVVPSTWNPGPRDVDRP
jgi:Ni,Fe-hydrogenase I large subunit